MLFGRGRNFEFYLPILVKLYPLYNDEKKPKETQMKLKLKHYKEFLIYILLKLPDVPYDFFPHTIQILEDAMRT